MGILDSRLAPGLHGDVYALWCIRDQLLDTIEIGKLIQHQEHSYTGLETGCRPPIWPCRCPWPMSTVRSGCGNSEVAAGSDLFSP